MRLVEAAAPIMLQGRRIAHVLWGPFSSADRHRSRREQGRGHGFDETAYLAALEEVPVVPETKVREILTHVVLLVEQLGKMRMNVLGMRRTIDTSRREGLSTGSWPTHCPRWFSKRISKADSPSSIGRGVNLRLKGEDLASGLSVHEMLAPSEHERAISQFREIVRGEHIGAREYLPGGGR